MGRRQRALLLGTASYLAVGLIAPRLAVAEVATDGTMGRRVSLSGPNIEIGADLGQQRGGNLFHSFKKFDVETKGRVAFAGPDSVNNVISRVTGGERSSIDGTLASDIPNADLYLINPAGILFGPNARLDVKGSFHASTAAELRLADGAVFSALDMSGSTLTVAEPRAFGFLGTPPGAITVDASLLEVGEGKALSLVGGDVLVNGDGNGVINDLVTTDARRDGLADEPGTVRARGGRVSVTALGGSGEVALANGATTGTASGTVALSREAAVVVNGDGGGAVFLRGGRILISQGSLVLADNLGDAPGSGGITVGASEIVDVRDAGQLRASAVGNGNGGNIVIDTPKLTIDGFNSSPILANDARAGIFVRAELNSRGDAGTLVVDAGGIELTNRAVITGATSGRGQAADLALNASGLFRATDSSVIARANGDAAPRANAGSISISAGSLELVGRSEVLAVAQNREGNGGTLDVRAEGGLTVDGGRLAADTRGAGGAGRVEVWAGTIDLRNDGVIESRSLGRNGGDGAVSVHAQESLRIDGATIRTDTLRDGAAGSVMVSSPSITLRKGRIASESEGGVGAAGTVTIDAGSLQITGGEISTTARTAPGLRGASGDAGTVTVRAGDIELREGGQIRSITTGSGDAGAVLVTAGSVSVENSAGALAGISVGTDGSGDGGRVFVSAREVTVSGDQASIAATTRAGGHAGAVEIEATRLTLSNAGRVASQAVIDANTPRRVLTGDAGAVIVRAEQVELRDGGRITVRTQGQGAGGEVRVTADQIDIGGDFVGRDEIVSSGIRATADEGSTGNAGTVLAQANDVMLRSGGAITSSTAGTGKAGEVDVMGGRLTLSGQGIVSSGTASAGDAGNVTVAMRETVSLTGGSIATNSSGDGMAGNVVVAAPEVTLAGGSISSTAAGNGAAGTVRVATREQDLSTLVAIGAGAPTVGRAGAIDLSRGGSITTSTSGGGAAGAVSVTTGRLTMQDRGTEISSSTSGTGNAGNVTVDAAQRIVVDRARITSASTGEGANSGNAGNVVINTAFLQVEDGAIQTSGAGAEGGQIDIAASSQIYLRRSNVTSDGIEAGDGSSVIRLGAPQIILNASQVTSLTGDQIVEGSGQAVLDGQITIISADSIVAGSSATVISGLQTNLGSELQLAPGTFLDASGLLRDSCAAIGASSRSSFTRGGRGGLPPSPDRPLPSVGAEGEAQSQIGPVRGMDLTSLPNSCGPSAGDSTS